MANFTIEQNRIIFKINGKDTRSTVVIILLILLCFALSVILMLILARMSFFEDHPIVGGVLVMAFFLVLINGLLLLIKQGTFSRYEVTLSASGISGFDRRENIQLFTVEWGEGSLYIAETRQQIGYVSKKFSALCYGKIPQELVEDKKPSIEFALLTTGKSVRVEEVRNMTADIVGESRFSD